VVGDGGPTISINGRPVGTPNASLPLGKGARRRLLVALPADEAFGPDAQGELRRSGEQGARFRLEPLEDLAALAADFQPTDRARLLRFLVVTCAKLFGLRGDSEFAAQCMGLGRGEVRARLALLTRPDAAITLWRVPPAVPAGEDGPWHLVSRSGFRRIGPPIGDLMLLDGNFGEDALLLAPGADAPLGLAAPGKALPGLIQLAHGTGEEATALPRTLMHLLARRADADPRSAAQLKDLQLLAPAEPRRLDDPARPVGGALEIALSDHGGGVFLGGWIRDPLRLIEGLSVRGPFGPARALPDAALHRMARADLGSRFERAPLGGAGLKPGFVAHLPDVPEARHVVQWRLEMRLASGEAVEVVAPQGMLTATAARDQVLRAATTTEPEGAVLAGCIGPAVRRLHRAALAGQGAPEIVPIGTPARRPVASVVVPLYRNLKFLRFQLGAFARDAEMRRAELIYVLDSPEQRAEVEHLLRGLARLHDLALTLVVQAANGGYASACNAGTAVATAPVLLLLNSDVVPDAPGWLGLLLRRLSCDRRMAAVGPKLLFDDGSIQHAGLLFGREPGGAWYNEHYFKGFPRHYPPACAARRVPGITGAAFCVRRAAFEAAGGLCTDYVVGDYEDSDLCLKLRAAGHEIGYEPAAELFHFERQSIASHAGYARTMACAYNRRLHDQRWSAEIAALMARFPGSDG
jgi:GT2 family glycosyltransferase